MRAPHRMLAAIASLALATAAALAAGPVAAQAADIETVVGDFESTAEIWNFNLGADVPGAQGSFTRDAADAAAGAQSALVSADFSGGGAYVNLNRSLNNLDITSLTFQVRTADTSKITLRLTDSTGQTHQQRISLEPGGQWQEVTITDFAGGEGNIHYGGANDGIWHGPARSMGLLVDKGFLLTDDNTGQVRFDAVSVTATPPEIAIEQTTPGNIFVQPDPVVVDLATRGDTVNWSLRNFWGDEVSSGETAIDTTAEFELPIDTPGYYELTATASADGTVIGTTTTDVALLTPFETPPVEESRFGVAEHLSRPDWGDPEFRLVEIADKAGASAVREDATWSAIEREPGEYTFDRFDSMVDKLRDGGLEWFPMFGYTSGHYDNNSTPYTDAGRQAYANYTSATVEHYDLPWVEVYNEFNIGFGDRGDGPADSRADYYFPLLKTTYETVKADHPDVTVVGGVTSSVPFQWLEQLFQLGGLEYMDVLSIHPYAYPGAPESIEKWLQDLDALVREYNDGESIPIWITEQGWPTNDGATGVSEATQAAYLVRANVLAQANGIDRVFYYNMMNKGNNAGEVEHRYGLIRNTTDPRGKWAPKPGYVAYAAMTRALDGAVWDHEQAIGEGIESHVFDQDGTPVRVLWSTGDAASVTLETDGPVTVTDLTGVSQKYRAIGGRVHLTLGDDPVYVAGDVDSVVAQDKMVLGPVGDGDVAAGDDIELELTIDNSIAPRTPVRGTFEIAGTSVPVNVRAGQVATIPVTVPGTGELGPRELVGTLEQRLGAAARLTTSVAIVPPLSMTAAHRLDEAGVDVVRVKVANASVDEIPLDGLAWSIGSATGSAEIPAALPGGESHQVDIPLAGIAAGRHARELRLTSPGIDDIVSTGTVNVVASDAIGSMPQKTVTIDGVLDDLTGVPGVDLLTDGTVAIDDHGGPDDLGGQLWTTWDGENVYLSARIHDDVHSQPSSGAGVWFGDGFQFGFAAGLPGETRAWDELGISLTTEGPELYRWLAAEGRQAGVIEDAELAIVRNEDARETVYELAIPWAELTPFEPADRLLSFSLIVNENDGTGRRGWLAFGDGIATTKDPARYSPFRLDPLP